MTVLESKCKELGWTAVGFKSTWVEIVFEQLVHTITGKYCIIPEFLHGYDDPQTSKIYFQNSNDAIAFKMQFSTPALKQSETIGYFQFDESDDGFMHIAIVDKAYWDENGHLNGDGLSEEAEEALGGNFCALAECCYEHDFETHDDAKEALIEAGFEEKTDLI